MPTLVVADNQLARSHTGEMDGANQAVFLDLNGTIVLPLKQQSLNEMSLILDADHAIRRLLDFGFTCPVVTVQARIEKGLFTETEFRRWFSDFFGALGLDLKGPYVCPHRYTYRCACEKPNRLLYDQAASDFKFSLEDSYVIGDSPQDVQAAQRFAGTGCLVKTGWPITEEGRASASFVGDSIVDATDWILQQESGGKPNL